MARRPLRPGATFFDLQDQLSALKELQTILAIDPANVPARRLIARIDMQQNNPPAARKEIQLALHAMPSPELHFLSIALRSQGENSAAQKELQDYKDLQEFRSHLAQAKLLVLRGVEALKQQQYDQALTLFQQAIAQSPTLPTSHYYLGVTWERKGDAVQAAQSYEKALELQPDYARA